MVAHVKDALKAGHRHIIVTTADTDVVVILLGQHSTITASYPEADIWVGFGQINPG